MNKNQESLISYWWEKLQPLVNKFTKETILNGFEDDDIRQECFIQLKLAMDKFDESKNISFAYYYKVCLWGWRSNIGKTNAAKNCEIPYSKEQLPLLKDKSLEFEIEVERRVLFEKVKQKLKVLDSEERIIIVAHYINNKEMKKVAVDLGISYKNALYKKKLALNKLRKLINRK